MSKVRSNKILNGSGMPKAPTRAEVEAIAKKRKQEEKELVEKMNIPPRDEEKYPLPSEDDVKNAGAFIYTLGNVAESYDGNLKALLWSYYVAFMKCMRKGSSQEELLSLMKSLTELKEYLLTSGNPLFTDAASSK